MADATARASARPLSLPRIDTAREAVASPATASQPLVRISGLSQRFESNHGWINALRDIDFSVAPGEFCVIVGPSGCGKTTLLRILAGLEEPTSGSVAMQRPDGRAPSNAMVFQGRSVFPWLTVTQNVAYGLKLRGVDRRQRAEQAKGLLALVGLSRFARAYPHQLSEGMRQRVAIARALAVDPDLLLMDEPFGALDEQTRFLLQEEVLRIWEETKKTVVFVTHSIDEAMTMADRIVVMSAHPGTVLRTFDVPFPRPRELTAVRSDPRFAELFAEIWELLRQQVNLAREQEER
jgi:NitT/TauT family transport system ATP-binding protein